MELIKWKLDKITDVWNHYFWEYKSLQKKINFNSEVKTNYYGEILSYFNDTFDLIKINESKKFYDNIFHYTGLLQIIYVQQDLMDELLHIFKLQKSPLQDKNPNRTIRNELIGHPIRRTKNGNELESSSLFSNNTTNTTLEYLKYSKSNNFKMKITTYDTQTIIDQHKAFLNKYFDQILNKICVIFNAHKKNLKKFEQSISNNAKFDNVIHQTEISFEYILRFNYLYSKDILKECYKRQNEHSRYKFAIDLFLTELSNHLKESQNNIDDFVQEKLNDPKKYNKIEMPIYINDFIVGKGKIPKRIYCYKTFEYRPNEIVTKTIVYSMKKPKEIVVNDSSILKIYDNNNFSLIHEKEQTKLKYNQENKLENKTIEIDSLKETYAYYYINNKLYKEESIKSIKNDFVEKIIKISLANSVENTNPYEKQPGTYKFNKNNEMIYESNGTKYRIKTNGVWGEWLFHQY
jgi:hypothetical protein